MIDVMEYSPNALKEWMEESIREVYNVAITMTNTVWRNTPIGELVHAVVFNGDKAYQYSAYSTIDAIRAATKCRYHDTIDAAITDIASILSVYNHRGVVDAALGMALRRFDVQYPGVNHLTGLGGIPIDRFEETDLVKRYENVILVPPKKPIGDILCQHVNTISFSNLTKTMYPALRL